MNTPKTPINTIDGFNLTKRLNAILTQAYHRRSKTLPANLDAIVETLKGDLLKHFPDVPIETVDDAIIIETLNSPDTPLSPTFFYNAVKKKWWQPKTNAHQWDRDEEHRRPDTEQDTINLLDAMAKYYSVDHVNPLPIFGPPHLFFYLVMRGQLALNADDGLHDAAVQEVNKQRLAARHRPLDHEDAKTSTEVALQAKKLAVLGWLKACNSQGTTPSAILSPLMDSYTYAQHRRING